MKKYLAFLLLAILLKSEFTSSVVESPTMPEIEQEGEYKQIAMPGSQQRSELPVIKQPTRDQLPISEPSKGSLQSGAFATTSSDITIPQLSPDKKASRISASKSGAFDETLSDERPSRSYSDELSVYEARHVTQQTSEVPEKNPTKENL
jgi:hypothetical protein